MRLRWLCLIPSLLGTTLALAACGGAAADRTTADTSASSRSPANATSAARFTASRGSLTEGDERLTWESQVTEGRLRSIRELATFGDDGRAERIYAFDSTTALRQMTETRTMTAAASDRSPTPLRVTLQIQFAADTVVSSRKDVDGISKPVQPYETEQVQRRAALLLEQAQRAGTSTTSPP